ncbi:hypothetical protein MVEN_02257400 [Mycena venus]|uniref:Uncharacterized protein n=1 Tax=Mycena venus TaxID=2733690 RepID=A0A8H6X6E4_9AGAR|nr:hypothetical protein MVEN_02257400 [Mycena venus]
MQMFAQLIVDETIVQQTTPVDGVHTQQSTTWKLKFECDIPQNASTFWIAIMRKAQGIIRLIGFTEIAHGEGLSFGEERKPFHLPVVKVNPDGPLLNLAVAFSITISPQAPGIDGPRIQFGSLNAQAVFTSLIQMFGDAGSENLQDPKELWIMYERVLRLSHLNEKRGRLLNLLGDLCLEQWKVSHISDTLNQAVWAYEDAVRDGLTNAGSLHDLGVGLLHRSKELGDIGDINRCVWVMQDAVRQTPDGHPDKLSRLNTLGGSLFSSV